MLKLSKATTFAHQVKVRLPTDKPDVFNEGTITVNYNIKSKDEFVELGDKGLSDQEYFDAAVNSVDGLGDSEGNPISGAEALAETKSGKWSTFLLSAIISDYFEQYGEARVKNSRPSRGR